VGTIRLLIDLNRNEKIKSIFFIRDRSDLDEVLDNLKVTNEGYLSWNEFVELLFTYKHTARAKNVKVMSTKEAKDLTLKDKKDNGMKREGLVRVKEELKPIMEHKLKSDLKEKDLGKYKMSSLDYKTEYPKPKQKVEDKKITVPKPFNCQSKGKKILTSIPEEKSKPFRPNPVPISTTLPKYEMLQAKDEARRMEIKEQSYARTKEREMPFSFYEKDKEKYIKRVNADDSSKIIDKQYKANPLPPHVTVQLYEQMVEEKKAEREQRIKKNTEESLAKSKLPPRMALDYIKKKDKSEEFPFKPKAVRAVPDYDKQQKEFLAVLEKHKEKRKPTVLDPFEFNESSVVIAVDCVEERECKRERSEV
jgi:hypothetical protein